MLTLFRPHLDLLRHARYLDSLFADPPSTDNGTARWYSPAVDIAEEENHFVLTADLPGVDEKNVELTVHEGVLILTGKREAATEKQSEGGYHRERRHGSFTRQFRLGSQVDAEKIAASYKDGVLTVTIPKKEEIKPRQIPVSTS
jgi:HSP20 family protein